MGMLPFASFAEPWRPLRSAVRFRSLPDPMKKGSSPMCGDTSPARCSRRLAVERQRNPSDRRRSQAGVPDASPPAARRGAAPGRAAHLPRPWPRQPTEPRDRRTASFSGSAPNCGHADRRGRTPQTMNCATPGLLRDADRWGFAIAPPPAYAPADRRRTKKEPGRIPAWPAWMAACPAITW